MKNLSHPLFAAQLLWLLPLSSCADSQAAAAVPTAADALHATDDTDTLEVPVQDAQLAEYQQELLTLAFEAASAMPLDPHIKNRSRAQEQVVLACFELDLPNRALEYVGGIDNWRRGAGYADYALYCVRHGEHKAAERYLELALEVASWPEEEIKQAWRRDRIRAKVAGVWAMLGDYERADEIEGSISENSELGKADTYRAMVVEEEELAELRARVDRVAQTGDMDQVRNALDACAELFGRFYEHEELSAWAENRIRSASAKLPFEIRMEALCGLAERALEHGAAPHALALADEALGLFEDVAWSPEHSVAWRARLARLRFEAGADRADVRAQIDAALAEYDAERERIVDIFRGGVLRPVAEAYHALGARELALKVYKRVLEESLVNPNSRPRVDDLVATCCSLVARGVEPDDSLMDRLRKIRTGLAAPW